MVFRIHDVGGQRSDRRKWLYLFDCVHAVSMKYLSKYSMFYLAKSFFKIFINIIKS